MTGEISSYSEVNPSNKETKIVRFKELIISVAVRLWRNFRKYMSRFNICRNQSTQGSDEILAKFTKLNLIELKKLTEMLMIIQKNEADGRQREFNRPGYIAPTTSPVLDDLELETVETPVKTIDSNDRAPDDESVQSVDAFQKVTRQMKPRPKAAKGRRVDIVIPPYIEIDETQYGPTVTEKKPRPKAAKCRRPTKVPELLDLPADILVEKLRGCEDCPHFDAKSRGRPLAARVRRDNTAFGVAQELLTDTAGMSASVAGRPERPLAARGERTVIIRDEREYIREHITEVKVNAHNDSCDDDSDTSDDDSGDIFSVPYLPKSQRKFATALKLPWEK